jgi:hypothetical protein
MGNTTSIKKINFEDILYAIKNNNYLIINTLNINEQTCLIKKTVTANKEVELLNQYLNTNKNINIIIYGRNSCDESVLNKYDQLTKLGFYNVCIYSGGIFEWLLLQEVYGKEEFPTTSQELDILKYKGRKTFDTNYLIENS